VDNFPQFLGELSTALAAGILDFLNDLRDLVVDVSSFSHLFTDLLCCIHNRGVVAISEVHTDLRKR